jgi:N-acetyl-anhydromuramyl-L-alanine amidase AmpD
MNFQEVVETEILMKTTGFKGAFKIAPPVAVPIANEPDLSLVVQRVTPASGHESYYYPEKFPKKQIMLHFTEGQIRGDLTTLTRLDKHISVPFVVARDGTVYTLFSSEFWSHHVGKTDLGDGGELSKAAVGIEVSNYGPLTLSGSNLLTPYGDVYCALSDKEMYTKLDKPFRGTPYYASYTEAQYDALIVLLRYLTKKFNIPRAFLPEDLRFITTPKALTFNGIITHVNYREHKCDIGPAFEWAKVIAGVKAPTFEPNNTSTTRSLGDMPEYVESERALYPAALFRKRKILSDNDPEPEF